MPSSRTFSKCQIARRFASTIAARARRRLKLHVLRCQTVALRSSLSVKTVSRRLARRNPMLLRFCFVLFFFSCACFSFRVCVCFCRCSRSRIRPTIFTTTAICSAWTIQLKRRDAFTQHRVRKKEEHRILAIGILRFIDSNIQNRTLITGVSANDIQVAEVHDCFTIAEVLMYEALGFAAPGRGIDLAASGATRLDGRIPVNTGGEVVLSCVRRAREREISEMYVCAGGLIGFGHPVGATGVKQVLEIYRQMKQQVCIQWKQSDLTQL